jgi:serine protease Do
MTKTTRTEQVAEEERSYMGITGEDVSAEVSEMYGIPRGIFLSEVQPDSPAEKAGLKRGDVITKFDGSSVTSMAEIQKLLPYYAAGEEVQLTICYQSEGQYVEKKVPIVLGKLSDYYEMTAQTE